MFFDLDTTDTFQVYASRRKDLIQRIQEGNSSTDNDIVILFGAFENDHYVFRQESSFYYFSGVTEPSAVLVMTMRGETTMFVPRCVQERAQWVANPLLPSEQAVKGLCLTNIEFLGEKASGYQLHPFFSEQEYSELVGRLREVVHNKGTIYTLSPKNAHEYADQRSILHRLQSFIPDLYEVVHDVSPLVAQMRRTKDMKEIELLHKAIDITCMAHEAAARVITDGALEAEVQGALEYIFTASGASAAFPSIVGAGKNSTVLHYTESTGQLSNGDLVVVDIGARYEYYCADLTRTYPVSGRFTARQREIYSIVLETQEYIAECAKPGVWLSNKEQHEQSLHHKAHQFLRERGYDKYFPHGIGHFLGIDVHDVGDYARPLQEGDVITIEPGIYIPEEGLGVRIEDNYWIVKNGAVCLSEQLPKKPDEIEHLMTSSDAIV